MSGIPIIDTFNKFIMDVAGKGITKSMGVVDDYSSSGIIQMMSAKSKESGVDPQTLPFTDKLTLWAKTSAMKFLELIVIVYLPICLFIITRSGYSVGGTDLNNFPYRNPHKNKQSFSIIDDLYKQTGGGMYGPYQTVESPYHYLNTPASDVFGRLILWFVDTLASVMALSRFLLDGVLQSMGPVTGFNPESNANTFKFLFALFTGPIIMPILLIFAPIVGIFLTVVIGLLKVKDYMFPFAGTRLFSTATWIFILLLTGLFPQYIAIVFSIVILLASFIAVTLFVGFALFGLLAPFTYISKKYKSGNTGELITLIYAILNIIFWVFILMVLIGPTQEIFGAPAMGGGMIYMLFLFINTFLKKRPFEMFTK